MPRINHADIRALTQRLVQDGKLDKPDMDALVDAAMEDGHLSGVEKSELRGVLSEHMDKIESGDAKDRLTGFLGTRNAGIRNAMYEANNDGVVDSTEAGKIAGLVDADGRVSKRERYSLYSAMIGAKMTPEAREILLAKAADAAAPGGPVAPPTPSPPTSSPALVDVGLPEVAGLKFQLAEAGFLTTDGKPPDFTTTAGSLSFYRSADALSRVDSTVLSSLSPAGKAAMLDTLQQAFEAGRETNPLPDVAKQQLRSGAAATLLTLIDSSKGAADAGVREQAIGLYFGQAVKEPMHGVRASMFFNLERVKDSLSPADAGRLSELEKAVIPQAPPYDEWFADGERHIEVKHYAHEECWSFGTDPITAYKEKGYTVVETNDQADPATWIIEKKNPDAPGGEVSMRIEVIQSHDGIFQEMDDPDVNMVVYTGHSNLGGNVSEELRVGTAEKSSKLIMLAMCRGKQNMFEVANKYPSSHFVTTDDPSYFSSVMPMSLGMVEGALALNDYSRMKKDSPRIADNYGKDNYFYPNEPRRYAHYDLDKDGVIDSRGAHVDRLYDVALKLPTTEHVDGVARANAIAPEDLEGTKVQHAVQFLNTLMNYHVKKGHHTSSFKHGDGDNFLAGGWFDGPLNEKVRVVTQDDGKVEVQVNKALHDQSSFVLGAIVQFEATKLLLTERNGGTLTKKDEARAALFAGEYLAYMYCSLDEAVAAIRSVGRDAQHLVGVTFNDLHTAINADGHGYVTDKQVDALLQGL